MKNSLDVITIGEAMAMFVATQTGDLAEVDQFIKRVAGAELNVATGLARLGLKVGWVSRIGNDSFGRFILHSLKKEGIDAHGVILDEHHATGFQLKSKVENGTDPIVEYFRKNSAASHLSVEDYNDAYFSGARHLHLSGVAAALSASSCELLTHAARTMKAQGKTFSFDPNLRPVLWKSEAEMVEKLNRLAFQADWVLPGLKEGMILTGQQTPEGIADFYLHHGVKAVVLKTGADGAWYKTAEGEQGSVAPVKVDHVVDTVGAGDGFAVGVISALLEGRTLRQAIIRGNKIGALAIQVQGDSEGLPTREALGE
ncbi:2-dehydro-3-deoxygluconokinase [Citrobacter amalonaticus]|uniref:2-dehydro-3-deoxygluconokinase n=1 Tax=Citrobacter amalonaticus TaxID=35703 RepID=A0A2S4RV53_CITAM|nr:sugar kinase [Citrobacter amalonaticus]POT55576.1 2-dehydro-3-deoxygluconokinase [Citrobacter amalonaticus]POT73787.1 2-dehydro-3-deoxygluconokinase [Citrobacter amalonaticus]POU64012.1 2-dehydro-3-deoxygluconokinase [Citrobacter amalonaticus]POV03645.1 2-dehydro-3-deoxygluconokinase [Citrobacter amalonaticus]